jgi:HAD superfamily hydrolase (TIGR01450 family)
VGLQTAAILAAGIGSRLRPITTKIPKCMVKVGGKPILEYQLDAFKKAGITKAYIVVGYEAQCIIDYCRDYKGLSFEFIHNFDYESNNNMYSMYLLREQLQGKEFMFCNADVIYDQQIISKMAFQSTGNYIAVDAGTYDPESMKVTVDHDGFISGIRKTFREEAYGRSADLYRLSSEGSVQFFNRIIQIIEQEGNVREWTEVVIDQLSAEREILFTPVNIHEYPWVEIDNYDDLSSADLCFSNFDIDKYKVYFVDIDGTLALGDILIDGADLFIKWLQQNQKAYYFVTNNSSKSKLDYVKKLANLGIETDPHHIILSTDALIEWLKNHAISRVYCLGTESMKDELERAGITHVEEDPEHVVIGYDTELTYQKLQTACQWIHRGVGYSATHMDVYCPTPQGPIPDIGTFIQLIEMTTGRKAKNIFGKPNASMLAHLIGTQYLPMESVMIGDRIYTDKEMANRLGLDFICVLSGETKRGDLQELDRPNWPALVLPSISEILRRSAKVG